MIVRSACLRIFVLLLDRGPATVDELAELLDMKRANVAHALDRLAALGLAKRLGTTTTLRGIRAYLWHLEPRQTRLLGVLASSICRPAPRG